LKKSHNFVFISHRLMIKKIHC